MCYRVRSRELNLDEKEERSKEMQQARAYAARRIGAAEQAYSMILRKRIVCTASFRSGTDLSTATHELSVCHLSL